MKDDAIEQKANTEVEEWVVSLLTSLVHTAVEALNKKPFKMPDYAETTFRHGVTGVHIRVDFKEVPEE